MSEERRNEEGESVSKGVIVWRVLARLFSLGLGLAVMVFCVYLAWQIWKAAGVVWLGKLIYSFGILLIFGLCCQNVFDSVKFIGKRSAFLFKKVKRK